MTHSNVLAKKFHGQEKPGGLQSPGLQGHDWAHTYIHGCNFTISTLSRLSGCSLKFLQQVIFASSYSLCGLSKMHVWETSPVVQWLRPPSNAAGVGSVPGRGSETPHAEWCSQKLKHKGPIWTLCSMVKLWSGFPCSQDSVQNRF